MKKIKKKFFKILIVLPIICCIVLCSSLSVFAATGWTDANESAFEHVKLKQFNLYYIGNSMNGSLVGQNYSFTYNMFEDESVGYVLSCENTSGIFQSGYYSFKFYFDIINYNNNLPQKFEFDLSVEPGTIDLYGSGRTYLEVYSSSSTVLKGTSNGGGIDNDGLKTRHYISPDLPTDFKYGFNETGYGNVQCSICFKIPSTLYTEYLVFRLKNFEYKNIRPSASNPQSNNPILNDYGATEDQLFETTGEGFNVTADIDTNVVKATQSNIFSKGMVAIGKIFEKGLAKIPFLQTLFDYSMSFGFFAFLLGMTSLIIGVARTSKRNNNDKGGG